MPTTTRTTEWDMTATTAIAERLRGGPGGELHGRHTAPRRASTSFIHPRGIMCMRCVVTLASRVDRSAGNAPRGVRARQARVADRSWISRRARTRRRRERTRATGGEIRAVGVSSRPAGRVHCAQLIDNTALFTENAARPPPRCRCVVCSCRPVLAKLRSRRTREPPCATCAILSNLECVTRVTGVTSSPLPISGSRHALRR